MSYNLFCVLQGSGKLPMHGQQSRVRGDVRARLWRELNRITDRRPRPVAGNRYATRHELFFHDLRVSYRDIS